MRALIAILPGDGIGPEVTAEAARVLAAVGKLYGHSFEVREALVGGAAIDRSGVPLPADTVALCRAAEAVLLGAVGGPRWGPTAPIRPEQGLLALRARWGCSRTCARRPCIHGSPEPLRSSRECCAASTCSSCGS